VAVNRARCPSPIHNLTEVGHAHEQVEPATAG
jgi:hypothetical protein